MKRFTALYALFILTLSYMILQRPVYAQYGAYTGGAKDTGIVVDKQVSVKVPGAAKMTFVDNLDASDTRYMAEETATFTIRVRNTYDKAFGTVVVRDFVPDFIEPIRHEFNQGTRTVTIAAGTFQKGEEKTFTVPVKIVKNEMLPQDKTVICIVNKAQVDTSGASDQDTSQFCIERQVQGAKTVPAAGAETAWTALAVAMIGSGLFLRKHSALIRSSS